MVDTDPNHKTEVQQPRLREVGGEFRGIVGSGDHNDGRDVGDYNSRYPEDAREKIKFESKMGGCFILFFLFFSGVSAGFSGSSFEFQFGSTATFSVSTRLLLIYFMGCLGGSTFAIKWLVHTCAKGTWNEDRFYWRCFVPLIGGVYSIVVIYLMDSGFIGSGSEQSSMALPAAAVLSFLVGYFSDGVSGLLSNVANAVFGTVRENEKR